MQNIDTDKVIKVSYEIPKFIMIVVVFIFIWILISGLVGLFNHDFSFFSIISLLFVFVAIYMISILIHLANVELNGNFLYLKGILFSQKIELSKIVSIKQKWGLRKNYEPLIFIKTKNNNHIIKRFYLIPNNYSYDKKVGDDIYSLLNETILKAKNNNAR